jgi:hypothetical protein
MKTIHAAMRFMLHCNIGGFSLCGRHTLFPENQA